MMKILFLGLFLTLSNSVTNAKVTPNSGIKPGKGRIAPPEAPSPYRPSSFSVPSYMTSAKSPSGTHPSKAITTLKPKRDSNSFEESAKKLVAKASEIVQKAEESGKKAIEMVESTLKTLQNVTSTELKEYIKATMSLSRAAAEAANAETDVAKDLGKEAYFLLSKEAKESNKGKTERLKKIMNAKARAKSAIEAAQRSMRHAELSANLDFDALYEMMNSDEGKEKLIFRGDQGSPFSAIIAWKAKLHSKLKSAMQKLSDFYQNVRSKD